MQHAVLVSAKDVRISSVGNGVVCQGLSPGLVTRAAASAALELEGLVTCAAAALELEAALQQWQLRLTLILT